MSHTQPTDNSQLSQTDNSQPTGDPQPAPANLPLLGFLLRPISHRHFLDNLQVTLINLNDAERVQKLEQHGRIYRRAMLYLTAFVNQLNTGNFHRPLGVDRAVWKLWKKRRSRLIRKGSRARHCFEEVLGRRPNVPDAVYVHELTETYKKLAIYVHRPLIRGWQKERELWRWNHVILYDYISDAAVDEFGLPLNFNLN